MTITLRLAAAALALTSLGVAHADVVYSNPYNGIGAGNCLYNTTCGPFFGSDDTYAAQQFTLASSTTITSASFTSLVVGSTGSSVNYAFYTSDGLPDTLLASGSSSFASISGVCDPIQGCGNVDDTYTFDVTPITLGAGTYYFAIQEVTSNLSDYLGPGIASSGAAQSNDGGATWTGTYQGASSVAVSLFDTAVTPEPSALYLLGSGLAGVAALRRRFVRK